MEFDPNAVRKEYERGRLLEEHAPADPFALFSEWYLLALGAQIVEPNAMTLATATATGRPSARVVLLKSFDERGFVFFTNYLSRKGEELTANPFAALCFWWVALERQVRIEGRVEKLPVAESDAYFASRPLGSRLGALVSAQSQVISGRAALEERLAQLQTEYAAKEPERPAYWGGYLVVPQVFEFWQGGPHRLHDRLRYTRGTDGWLMERLSP
jgi:pyridoxamine 5'-phosphate oxidase